ncbi:CpaF family protein [Paenibacillus sp. MBLB4367]|uniref:CpaF family protein n=1 Tax=Paenibacillus sp. MBLB4367 TaxID=3384767 RepID=UPI003907F3D3
MKAVMEVIQAPDDLPFRRLREHIAGQMDYSQSLPDEKLLELIESEVFAYSDQVYLTAGKKKELVRRLYDSFRGLDILQPLVDDPSVTEIMINGPDRIFIERDGKVIKVPDKFESVQKLEDVVQSIVAKVNRVVNDSSPIVDARLKDGSRVNVVLSPVSLDGTAVTIRKFPSSPMTIEDLVRRGALTNNAARLLERLVAAKYNLFIGGGTGSGKTTFLNALSQFIPPDERIITIEDSAELRITSVPNLIRLETRNANTEGKGEITIRELIRTSLRMRPNRIIVGEVRGAEALDMLSAMNTGHDGSLSTGHANSSSDMLGRLETMVLSGADLPMDVVRKQIASAIDILVHLSRMRDKSRRVTEIHEVCGFRDGEIRLNPLYLFRESEGGSVERVLGELTATGNSLQNRRKLEMAGMLEEMEAGS